MAIERFYCCGCKKHQIGKSFIKFDGLQETGKYCYSCWLKNRDSSHDELINYYLGNIISDVIDGIIDEGEYNGTNR